MNTNSQRISLVVIVFVYVVYTTYHSTRMITTNDSTQEWHGDAASLVPRKDPLGEAFPDEFDFGIFHVNDDGWYISDPDDDFIAKGVKSN